jgi:hypothetical protein
MTPSILTQVDCNPRFGHLFERTKVEQHGKSLAHPNLLIKSTKSQCSKTAAFEYSLKTLGCSVQISFNTPFNFRFT